MKVKGSKLVRPDENVVKQVIANYGPNLAALEATDNLAYHSRCVFEDYSSNKLIHAALIVVYSKDKVSGEDYWLMVSINGSVDIYSRLQTVCVFLCM